MIWTSLAERAIYPEDREQCFRWFAEVRLHVDDHAYEHVCSSVQTIDEVGFDIKTTKDFFQHQIMKLEPHLLTDLGMK